MKAKPTNDAGNPLLAACARLRFEPHDIAGQLDARGRYEVALAPEFPLSIKLFRYTSRKHTRGETWHERLELFVPLDGPVKFRMGDQTVALGRGDVLVVDNLKVHHVVDFPGFDTRAIVVSFRPEFVYSLGSPSGDYTFLLPFYSRTDRRPHVVRSDDVAAGALHASLADLLRAFFGADDWQFVQAGSKAFLLAVLYHLARRFRASDVLKWEFMRQQERSLRLKKLFDHIRDQYAEKLAVGAAARMVGMSPAAFAKAFKQVAGMTLLAYLNHARLGHAARLLRETDRSIADIAVSTGFSDQSYFDRRFKAAFGMPPNRFRTRPESVVPRPEPGIAGQGNGS